MKYRIGEFSKLLGVTVDTLKHYESLQIIEPLKDEKNNYRYFDDYDARTIIKSRTLRSLNLPLDDVAKLMESDSTADVIEKMEESKQALKEQIHKNTLLLNKMTEVQNEIIAINSSLHKFKLKSLPGLYRLQHTDKDKLLNHSCIENAVSSWMNALPYTFSSFRIKTAEFLSGPNSYDYNWGQAIWENELEYVDLEINEDIEYIPPQTYLSTVLSSTNREYFLSNSRTLIMNHIDEHLYAIIKGDIVGKLIFTSIKKGLRISYIEIYIPVQGAGLPMT
ncbi:MerR family transcriptional regulator [Desulfitobacterium chlororespirans]|uniref:Transcriptional regulator, MerR family n=1 Tax=Desulfitobacterium chlororespirans DSM 11544 TaxID=1121395 RepID=A0A1M7SN88_9FIRM|nr:MerR family transcriptional regulator [Desulfitobacterium chlororespirans]SHN59931.1 transcriptional regulator, MerR family [Desulfitobacterium chlororespirans DSM 11544]